jgi:tRNA threonylcarbamoyladenosine biosynthesis protein TsaE
MSPSEAGSERRTFDLPDESATHALARALAGMAGPGDVIALAGDLGVGKTSFARAFINALPAPWGTAGGGEGDEEEVPSPTFTLVQVYERAPAPVWHVDLYRIEQPEEAEELGLEDAFASAITLIEWPERLGGRLPADRLDLRLSYGDAPDARRAVLQAHGGWWARLAGAGLENLASAGGGPEVEAHG